jgi:hypothetical protein
MAAGLLVVAAAAALAYAALGIGARCRAAAVIGLIGIVLLTPLLAPVDRPVLRLGSSMVAITMTVKLVDLLFHTSRRRRPGIREYAAFLPNPFGHVLRRLDDEPRPSWRSDLLRAASSAVGAVVLSVGFAGLFLVDWRRYPFLAEHSAKVLAFFGSLTLLAAVASSAWRLAGGRARDAMNFPVLARTPAELWRRYNRPAAQFFHEDVFLPLGGRRRPVLAVIGVFVVSAAVHEYVFWPPIGRVQGYQTAFFLVQGLAVLLTRRLRPRGLSAAVGILGTLAFNLITSVLFFASVGQFIPFYDSRRQEAPFSAGAYTGSGAPAGPAARGGSTDGAGRSRPT